MIKLLFRALGGVVLLLILFFFTTVPVWAENVTFPDEFPPKGLQSIPSFGGNDYYSVSLAPTGSDSGKSPILSGNNVTLNSDVVLFVFGAVNNVSLNSDAVTGNNVFIIGGFVLYSVFGGYANDIENTNKTTASNTVTMSGGMVAWGGVYGGHAYSYNGTATTTDNTATISDGMINGSVYGGDAYSYNGTATATDNTATISGDAWVNYAYGGYAYSNTGTATTTDNSVTISSGTIDYATYGGYTSSYTGNATATGNTVTISGDAWVSYYVYGGYAYSVNGTATTTDNSVTINGGTVAWGGVYGGYAYSGSDTATTTGNTVTISGGTVNGSVYGGYASSYTGNTTATGNSVTISDGTTNNVIIGGTAESFYGTTTVTGNTVTISGGTINNTIYGGYAYSSTSTAQATGNTVTISGSPTFGATARLYGGSGNGNTSSDFFTGNTLNLHSQITVARVQNFEYLNFYVPSTLAAGDTMLTVTGTADITGSTVRVGVDGNTSALDIGDTITLINADTLTGADALDGTRAPGIQGIANVYNFDLSVVGNTLIAEAAGIGANEQVKALSEGRAAGLAFLSQGADLIVEQGLHNLIVATQCPGLVSFGTIRGGTSRYKTGSHVDVDGVSMILGLGWRVPMEPQNGSLVTGVFFEAGWGNYNSYNSFTSMSSVKGKGNTSYYGGGILGRYEKPVGPGGIYGEASFRAGRVNTDFNSKDILNSEGDITTYDSGSAYYGAHLGLGYAWKVTDKSSLDFSTRYIWTHQASDSVTISGDKINFENADSQRWRSGVRFSHVVNKLITPYAGAYYEHEFNGKVRATINDDSIDAPKLEGSTGIGEIGLTLKPSKDLPLSFDLGVQGYVGKREGVTGSFQIKYEF